MFLQSQIDTLRRITHSELLNLGFWGYSSFSNNSAKLNTGFYSFKSTNVSSFPHELQCGGRSTQLCYVLLTGCHATIYDHVDKNQKIRRFLIVVGRYSNQLPASLLKMSFCWLVMEKFDEEDCLKGSLAIIRPTFGRGQLTLAEWPVGSITIVLKLTFLEQLDGRSQ